VESNDKLAFIELQIERLTELADPSRMPSTHFFLRHALTREQQAAIYRLLDDNWKRACAGEQLDAHQFEHDLSNILRKGVSTVHPIAKELLTAFDEMGQFREAIAALRATGWLSE
jgi:hypothetical protein